MILILGGTTEGRTAVKITDEAGKTYYYSTKGNIQEITCKNGIRLAGTMDSVAMTAFCREKDIRLLIDAAHPFAAQLHENIAQTARNLQIPVIRLERIYPLRQPDIHWCEDYEDAVSRLLSAGIENLLALTGVQTITALKRFWEKHFCRFRVLEREDSVAAALRQGFPTGQLVFYRPEEGESALINNLKPQAILTKESGISGGFTQKVEAARQAGIAVFAVKRPPLPPDFITVTGEHGLRKAIERLLPGFYPLRSGYTTGTCATAASKAALLTLLTGKGPTSVNITLPGGEEINLPVARTLKDKDSASCTVIKDAGDDPDVTNGSSIIATLSFHPGKGIRFLPGEGVGTVTLPGIGLPVGEPAVNPVPRQMIIREITALYKGGIDVTLSIPGGRELAQRTFNPKLGIRGGLSILGTSGVVRPFSSEAFVEAIRREIEVCVAVGSPRLVLNSGAKSERYVKALYPELPPQAFVHYGNFIGDTLKIAHELHIGEVSMGIMLGKAVKLAEGYLDTHSRKVTMNKAFIKELMRQAGCSAQALQTAGTVTLARELWKLLAAADRNLFFPALLEACMQHCAPLLPEGNLTILLIDEEGNIPFTGRHCGPLPPSSSPGTEPH